MSLSWLHLVILNFSTRMRLNTARAIRVVTENNLTMFLGKNRNGPDRNVTTPDAANNNTTSDASKALTLTKTASDLLEFRLFAIKNGDTYLSRIIEPVVKEALNIAHQLDQRLQTNSLVKDYKLREIDESLNPDLNTSELECLKWCSLGKSCREIATELGIQEATVIRQMNSARQKLGTHSDAHSVAKLIRLKII